MADMHRISFEPVNIEMEVGEDEKILDAAFRQGIHLMHGCREGRCSACKSYLLDGDIQMENYSTFACNDAEVEEGYVLLCRSHAFSDCTIELLNFDEDELLGGVPIQDVRATVTAVQPVTRDIVSLRLEAVEPATFEFKPGQYADIGILGSDEHRSFSMATTQSTPGQVEFLSESEHTRVVRLRPPEGPSVVRKEPLGSDAEERVGHSPIVVRAGGRRPRARPGSGGGR